MIPNLGIHRRALLKGVGALLIAGASRTAHAAKPIVLILTSDASARTNAIVEAFKAAAEAVTRVSYELGPEADAAAFLADNIRDMTVAAVFAVGDKAFSAAAREFASTPVLFTDVQDTSLISGRDNLFSISTRVDPAAALEALKKLLPRMYAVGSIRGTRDTDDAWWAALEQAAAALKLQLKVQRAGNSSDVQNGMSALLAACQAVWIQPDPGLWTAAQLSSSLNMAQLARVPVIGFDRTHLTAANPAPFLFESGGPGLGQAAAARCLSLLKLGGGAVTAAWPTPWLVGSRSACRSVGVLLNKDNAALVNEWLEG